MAEAKSLPASLIKREADPDDGSPPVGIRNASRFMVDTQFRTKHASFHEHGFLRVKKSIPSLQITTPWRAVNFLVLS